MSIIDLRNVGCRIVPSFYSIRNIMTMEDNRKINILPNLYIHISNARME